MSNPFEEYKQRQLDEKERELLTSLKMIEGVELTPGVRVKNTFILRFVSDDSMVSMYLSFFDEESGADLAITSMTNLPTKKEQTLTEVRSRGQGSEALQKVIAWAKGNNLNHIVATQVQAPARKFWERNGFVYDGREGNFTEDWIYKG